MSLVVLGWMVVLGFAAVALVLLSGSPEQSRPSISNLWHLSNIHASKLLAWLEKIKEETVAQIVPSIVVAIFVFAVGTAFVIAQIVPPTRGTRAATTLHGRRMLWTIAPAPGLIIGSVLAVLVNERLAGAISVAILVGAIVYLLEALVMMLALLLDATDPSRFKRLLVKKAEKAMKRQANLLRKAERATKRQAKLMKKAERVAKRQEESPTRDGNTATDKSKSFLPDLLDPERTKKWSLPARRQRATDALYTIVRTARGWVWVAARTNDSRELHESLEAILELMNSYATKVLAKGGVDTVPLTYWSTANERLLNPLYSPVQKSSEVVKDYAPWAPPRVVRRPPHLDCATLPSTWMTNEIGRAVVRAIEVGIQANSLLDRDTFRLLNTLANGASLFNMAATEIEEPAAQTLAWNAGVMVRYLVEVGLGVRHSPADQVDWYREPAVRLTRLQQEFASWHPLLAKKVGQLQREVDLLLKRGLAGGNSSELEEKKKELDKKSKELSRVNTLATGAAAGVLLVAASVITAPGRHDDVPGCWWEEQDAWDEKEVGASHEVPCAIVNAAGRLYLTDEQAGEAVKLALGPVFEPGERLIVDQADGALQGPLLDQLLVKQCNSLSRHQRSDPGDARKSSSHLIIGGGKRS